MNAKNLFHEDGKSSNVWYCSGCKLTAPSKEMADRCCEPVVCPCGSVVEDKHYGTCRACRADESQKKELEAATEAFNEKNKGVITWKPNYKACPIVRRKTPNIQMKTNEQKR